MKKQYKWLAICLLLIGCLGLGRAQPGGWKVSPLAYSYSMTLVAKIHVNGVPNDLLNNHLAMFRGNEIRGYTTPVKANGQALFFLNLYSSKYKDDTLRFMAFIGADQKVYESSSTILFKHHKTVGKIVEPFVVNFTLGTRPIIYSLPEVEYAEGSCNNVLDVQSSDNQSTEGNGLNYSLLPSPDASRFSIHPTTGLLSWQSGFTPDVEMPEDVNGDNRYEVKVRVRDANGIAADQDITVTVKKSIPVPPLVCPENLSVLTNDDGKGNCSATIAGTTVDLATICQSYDLAYQLSGATTASGVGLLPIDQNFDKGVTMVTYKQPGVGQCSFTVTVVDMEPPAINCPVNRTVNTDAGQCGSVQTYTVTATDNCATYMLERTNGFPSGSSFPSGFNVVNWKVTDAGGNSTVCSFSITVRDAVFPTISCPSDILRNNDPGQCTAVVNYVVNANDNCAGWSLSRTAGLASGAQFPSGTTTVTWRNTDSGANTVTCSFNVTVLESQAPTISCPANIVKAAGADCKSQMFYVPAGISDNCPGVVGAFHSSSPTTGLVSGSLFPTGISTVVLKATDAGGLTGTCSFTVTITDNTAPTMVCPANRTVNTDAGQCHSMQTYTVTATDNCSGLTTTMISGLNTGANFPKGITNVTWRATDSGGRTATCQFRVTVNDRQAPVITCPSDRVVGTDAGLCTAVVSYTNATFVDNCVGGSVTKFSGPNSGSVFPKGITNVFFRATDAAGNSSLCSMKVTVNDNQLPKITCPSSITRNTDANQCRAVVSYTNPTGTDNCAGLQVNLQSGLANGSSYPTGITTNVWRATDGAGLSSTCSFTVTISDAQLPTISCPPPTAVSGSGSPCGYPKSQLPNPTASDNCAVISLTSDAPTTLPAGPTTITWTAKDAANNARTCAYVVTVNCGTAARYEVGSMKYEERYEVGSMKYDAERESPSSLILHPSSLTLVPNPASDIVVVTLSNQQINSTSNQQHSGSNQQINSASNQQLLIHDALGRQVWARKLEASVEQIKIDLAAERIEDGVYQISWVTEEGVITKSLVVAKR